MSESESTDTVRVLFFSALREAAGLRTLDIEISGPVDRSTLLDLVCAQVPAVREWRSLLSVAVNLEYADADTVIQAGDEVALVTPVSGG
jgi:molybdopterin synthase sulfur carrier subunit